MSTLFSYTNNCGGITPFVAVRGVRRQRFLALMLATGLLTLLAWGPAAAQRNNGIVRGQISDKNGSVLPGASVSLKGTLMQAATDVKGSFQILDVPAGTYTLQVSYMGYKPFSETITVGGGKTTVRDVVLQMNRKYLSGVTVSAVIEGQQKALNQQKNADNIKQVVSADLIGRYPDLNVAESMQRLPGVTIGRNSSGEGSTIQLRGTPANFTNININGEQIMSTQENGQRSITLDAIPVDLLASMEVNKTLMPDQDGDAIAGIIDLKSPTATSLKTRLSLDLGAGYNNLRSNLNGIGDFTVGKRFFADDAHPNGRLGVVVNGSYYKTKNGYDELNAQVWQQNDFGDGKGSIYFPTDVRYLFVQNQRARTGASATIDYNFNANSNIVANIMYSNNFMDKIRYRKRTRMKTSSTSVDDTGAYFTKKGRSYNEIKSGTEDNNNLSVNLEGQTVVGRVKLDAAVFLGQARHHEDPATFNFITGNIPLAISNIATDNLAAAGADWRNDASLFTYNTVETGDYNTIGQNFVTKADVTIPYKIGNNSAEFKVGYKTKFTHSERYRPNDLYVGTYAGDATAGSLQNFMGPREVSSGLMDGSFDFGLGVAKDATIDFFKNNKGTSDFPADSSSIKTTADTYYYDANENIVAGYLMNRIQFNKLMLLAGLRVENTTVNYKGRIVVLDQNELWQSSSVTRKKNQYVKFLPNLQAKYDITKSMDARGALTFGYSRPDFIDLAPGRLTDILSETITEGNPELQPAFSTNLDFMLEKYLSNLGILSAGLFYKDVAHFQYNSVKILKGDEFAGASQYTGWQWYQILNGDKAKVYGVELNAQANLTFLPGVLKGFSILANYTYTHSNANAQFRKDIRLPGQATNTANASLAFTYKRFTIQGNLNYNGSYTVSLGADAPTDVVRAARVQIDANASYMLGKRFTLYAQGLNLTNAPQVDYFGVRSRIYTKQYYSYWGRIGVKLRL